MSPNLCLNNGCNLLEGHRGKCNATPSSEPLEGLPQEIIKKLLKTKQTRGAQPYDRVPYQNRVNRSNKVVIPFRFRDSRPPEGFFENGYIIMARPEDIIDASTGEIREDFPESVVIGENAFVFYDNRRDWRTYPPERYGWQQRKLTLNGRETDDRRPGAIDSGDYLARIPAITTQGEGGDAIVRGPPQGIRFFEYASELQTFLCMMQLAYLASKIDDINEVTADTIPSSHLEAIVENYNLNDETSLESNRVLKDGVTCCPLCLEPIKASELMNRAEQVEGREVVDLTVTEANLFHLKDIKPGEYNHRINLLGWGHYHCNTVCRDNGIEETLEWMETVLRNNERI